jgi:hypothetical protein
MPPRRRTALSQRPLRLGGPSRGKRPPHQRQRFQLLPLRSILPGVVQAAQESGVLLEEFFLERPGGFLSLVGLLLVGQGTDVALPDGELLNDRGLGCFVCIRHGGRYATNIPGPKYQIAVISRPAMISPIASGSDFPSRVADRRARTMDHSTRCDGERLQAPSLKEL